MTRAERMNGALGGVLVTSAIGLFAPGNWHPFLFGAILVWCLVGVYQEPADVAEEDPAA